MDILNNENGKYIVEDKAIQSIVQLTCLKIDDIKPSKKEDNFCIINKDDNNNLIINIQIRIKKGIDVEKTCNKIQSDINDILIIMLGIDCKNINIDIQGFIND